jgi:hypothetical protein
VWTRHDVPRDRIEEDRVDEHRGGGINRPGRTDQPPLPRQTEISGEVGERDRAAAAHFRRQFRPLLPLGQTGANDPAHRPDRCVLGRCPRPEFLGKKRR